MFIFEEHYLDYVAQGTLLFMVPSLKALSQKNINVLETERRKRHHRQRQQKNNANIEQFHHFISPAR